jgi:hypothetical protein
VDKRGGEGKKERSDRR